MLHPLLTLGENFWTVHLSKAGFLEGITNPSKVSVSFTAQQTRFSQIPSPLLPCETLRYRVVKG